MLFTMHHDVKRLNFSVEDDQTLPLCSACMIYASLSGNQCQSLPDLTVCQNVLTGQ